MPTAGSRADTETSGWRPLRLFIKDYQWIHLGLGLIGNVSFLVGSVFFLYQNLQTAGTWLFIVGAAGMLIGSVGNAIVKYETQVAGRV